MKTSIANILDPDKLKIITPESLRAYACNLGWHDTSERYRKHSVVYAGKDLPTILIPITQRLGDYATIVAGLINIFSEVSNKDPLEIYQELRSELGI